MKSTIKATAALLLSTMLLCTACNKEIDPVETHNEDYSGSYKVTALQLQVGTEARNLFTTLEDCQKQSVQVLSANYSYQLINACNAAENESGTWNVNGRRITINGVTGDLVSFNGRNLVITFDEFMGMPGRMTETLTRQ